MKYLSALFAMNCCYFVLSAQIVLSPLPTTTDGFRMEDTWRIYAMLTGSSTVTGSITLNIEDNNRNMVYSATLPNIVLKTGVNNIQQMNGIGASTNFGQSPAATIFRQTGSLPYGEFIICYFFNDIKSNVIVAEYCYEKSVVPMLPPELLQPFDKEEIALLSPLLVWKAPFPIPSTPLTYSLLLVEINKGQTSEEAIERNAPLISRKIKGQTQLIYPADAPSLEDGKRYAWKISVSIDEYNLGTTEAWEFNIKQEKIRPRNDSYRLLTDKPDGNVFVSKNGVIRFAYNNRYSMDTLQYCIQAANTDENKMIPKLPIVKLTSGVNKIDIDLNSYGQMENGKKYMIHITQKNRNDQYLEFVYAKGN